MLAPFLGVALQVAAAQPTPYQVLRAEHTRGADMATIRSALSATDTTVQRLAARAIGRIERAEHALLLRPLYRASAVSVRIAAINAAAQLKSVEELPALLEAERDGTVRGAIFDALGRAAPLPDSSSQPVDVEAVLARGLNESGEAARGAARGFEAWARRTSRARPLSHTSVTALSTMAVRDMHRDTRLAAMLALLASGTRNTSVLSDAVDRARRDPDAQLRRVGVMLGRRWVDDTSALVRWQALRVAGTCARAESHLRDVNEHVALLAIDVMGEQRCDPSALQRLRAASRSWRVQARATLALARLKADGANDATRQLAASPVWQARAWAAQAARVLGDSATLRALAMDPAPNVALAALHRESDALRALTVRHAGLVLTGAEFLKGNTRMRAHVPAMRAAFERVTREGITWRDPRVALFARLDEAAALPDTAWFRRRLADVDPLIAATAARVLTRLTGVTASPATTTLPVPSFPTESEWQALRGATMEVRFRNRGTVVAQLFPDDAPATVQQIAGLAARGAFTGLTIHRIVPNFVIQGGSPGADEYDPVTQYFMRDEVGGSHVRGTFGISTRGRDTGDGQLFVNLVDNLRLDHDYTVFGTTIRGLDVIDAIEEGDVIESVRIRRRP